mgnify:CR=1 FL=1
MTIFENDFIKVEKGYDFLCKIRNKTNQKICVHYDEPGYNDNYDPILIQPNSWIGIKNDDEGYDWIRAIRHNQIYVATNDDEIGYYPTGCSMTQWNDDCEEITNEVERILNEYNLYDHDRNTNVANSNRLATVLEILKNIK